MWQTTLPVQEFEISWEQFQCLPRHPSYRYSYQQGRVTISPELRYYHARLKLPFPKRPENINVQPLTAADLPLLENLFADGFQRFSPFAELTEAQRRQCVEQVLQQTWRGEDGPLIPQCCVLMNAPDTHRPQPLAAALMTLIPDVELSDFDPATWRTEDVIRSGKGQPHLTWIVVAADIQRRGWGEKLFTYLAAQLSELGYQHCVSTILYGNTPALLWHWRMGFELLSYPLSPRRLHEDVG